MRCWMSLVQLCIKPTPIRSFVIISDVTADVFRRASFEAGALLMVLQL